MIRTKHTRNSQTMHRVSPASMVSVEPDELKMVVRDVLVSMTTDERNGFILDLETALRSAHVSMRSYLFLLGIPATSPHELTPGDVGHLVRFLKINVPSVMRAVDELIARFSAFAADATKDHDRLAA